jgi:type I restriction enzyme M protein
MKKSLGDKRREIPLASIDDIVALYRSFRDHETRVVVRDGREEEAEVCRVFPFRYFGYRRVTVERPLRLAFQVTPDALARLEAEKAFQALAVSRKKGEAGAREAAEGRALQAAVRRLVQGLPTTRFLSRDTFEEVVRAAAERAGWRLPAPALKAVLSALGERDEGADVCRKKGAFEPDPDRRDSEAVPLDTDVEQFFADEVKPHAPDAWIDTSKTDPRDGKVGVVGYEINVNRVFYRYRAPRPLEQIEADLKSLEDEIVRGLARVTRSSAGR